MSTTPTSACSSRFVMFVNTGEEAVTDVLGHGEGEAEIGEWPRGGPEGVWFL